MIVRCFAKLAFRCSVPAICLASFSWPVDAQQLQATQIATGVSQPMGVQAPPRDIHRLFVLDRVGRIRVLRDGVILPAYFLDISSDVVVRSEGGLLALAFHPDYASNGRFFVSFTSAAGGPTIREYHVSATNPDVADPASGITIFGPYPHGESHYGGDLQFGPDGKLYYSIGQRTLSAQSSSNYEGKVLRIDVDAPAPYVPVDNPYAGPGDPGLDLIWALGLRNPWRLAFDRLTGDLFIGDVGEVTREEIDFQRASFGAVGSSTYQGGRNYGWPCMEGTLCTSSSQCTCDTSGATLALPVFETLHSAGELAMIGGYPYRGHAIPSMQGHYFCVDHLSGHVWSFVMSNGQATQLQDHTAELHSSTGQNLISGASFGQDGNGELYLASLTPTGRVYRIDPIAAPCPAPQTYCSVTPNSVGSGARIDSTGSASLGSNELVLTATSCPRNKSGVFFHGALQAQVPFTNGLRCVGGGLVRTGITQTDEHGFAHRAFDAVAAGMAVGQTRNFQFYFRDPAAGGALANLSDGLSVTFCP